MFFLCQKIEKCLTNRGCMCKIDTRKAGQANRLSQSKKINSKLHWPSWRMQPMGSGGNRAACLMRRSADEDEAFDGVLSLFGAP